MSAFVHHPVTNCPTLLYSGGARLTLLCSGVADFDLRIMWAELSISFVSHSSLWPPRVVTFAQYPPSPTMYPCEDEMVGLLPFVYPGVQTPKKRHHNLALRNEVGFYVTLLPPPCTTSLPWYLEALVHQPKLYDKETRLPRF
jgi:hypothetical protein